LKKKEKKLNISSKDRTDLFNKIGPGIAEEMSKALQKLISKETKVEFTGVQTLEQSSLSVDAGEKCFGSYINFRSIEGNFEGIAVAIFPLFSARTMTGLLLKRYLKKIDKNSKDHEMKLSAFKEAVHIMLLTYITGVANALKVKLDTGPPKFISFRNIEFMNNTFLRRHSRSESLVSIGQFGIRSNRSKSNASMSSIKGRFVIVY